MDAVTVAHEQLRRMRGMNAAYHRQFFSDVRLVLMLGVALFVVAFAGVAEAVLLVPFVMLWGACQTAFDASYLHFARHYAAALERYINRSLGEQVLVAGEIEDQYLYPLNVTKVVTVPLRSSVTWFGFMTAFTTMGGAFATVAAVWMSQGLLSGTALVAYAVAYLALALPAIAIGFWWFVGGAGEQKIRRVLLEAGLAEPR